MAYSMPDFVSWIEQGPTITRKRGSWPERILRIVSREDATKPVWASLGGSSEILVTGAGSGIFRTTWRSVTFGAVFMAW